MNINVLIDSLMVYAQENLLLDDLDVIYARNRMIQKLGVSDYEEYEIRPDMIDGMQNPYQLLNQITAFAVSEGKIAENDVECFEAELMALLIKRPSEIADTFNELIDHGKSAKAFLWLNEYNQKSGYVKFQNIIRHWEAKGTKGKIEVFIAKNTQSETLGSYPGCSKCPEVEGYKKYTLMRRAQLDLAGEECYWQFEENPYVAGLGYAIGRGHAPSKVNEKSLNMLFDFVNIAPNHFISLEESKGHGYFIGAVKQLPVHKAPELRKLKCSAYPYIGISELDWYTNVLRLTCTNREKLIEFILKFSGDFARQKEGNRVSVSVRKTDKYTVDLFLDNTFSVVDEKNTNIFTTNPDFLARMGIIVLPESLEDEIKQMDLYLTKEQKFSDANLSENMLKHKQMIAKILKEIGSTKISTVEAQIDIKEEINNICESTLEGMRVFAKNEEGISKFNDFLESIDIK